MRAAPQPARRTLSPAELRAERARLWRAFVGANAACTRAKGETR